MKLRLTTWFKKRLLKLILWAAGDELRSQAKQEGYAAGKTSAWAECAALREQMKALQMIDVTYKHRDQFPGKIILAASVRGQDFVQIIDVPHYLSLDEWKEMSFEIKRKFGAEVRYCDVPTHLRYMKDELVGVSKPLRK
jgi:hypothetical protein